MTLFNRIFLRNIYLSTLIAVPIIAFQCEVINTNKFSLLAQAQVQSPHSESVTVTLTQGQVEELEKIEDELRNDIESKYENTLDRLDFLISGFGLSLAILTAFPFIITLLAIIFNQSIIDYLNRDATKQIKKLNKQVEETKSKLDRKSEILNRVTSAFIFRQIMDLIPEVKWVDYLSKEQREKIYNNIEEYTELILKELKKLDSDELKDLPSNLNELIELLKKTGKQFFLRSIDYVKLGNILIFIDKYEDAIIFYDRAIHIAPYTQWEAYRKKGISLYKQYEDHGKEKDYLKKAEMCFKKSIEIDPTISKTWSNLSAVYYNYYDFLKAQEYAELALIKNPTDAIAYNNLGNALLKQNKKEEALINYQKAIEINSNVYHLYYNMACLYASDNNPDLAIKQLKKAIKLNPKAIEEAKKDPDFRELRENNEVFKDLIRDR